MRKRKVVPSEAGDQTRERILGAAEVLFARSGFDGVSMRDIGAAAEVPYALVTYHFKSKRISLKRVMQQMIAEADGAMYHAKTGGRNRISHSFDLQNGDRDK